MKDIDAIDLTRKTDKKYRNIIDRMRGRLNHTILRARQRYNVKMTEYDYFDLVNQIVTCEAEYLRPTLNGTYMYRVRLNGTEMIAIYEPAYAMITTIIRKDMI